MKTLEERRQELETIKGVIAEQHAKLRAAHEAACERGGTVLVGIAELEKLEAICARPVSTNGPSPLDAGPGIWIRC